LAGGGGSAAPDGAGGPGEGAQVHPVEFVTQVPPRVAGGLLGDMDQRQVEPAQHDMGADAVLEAVKHGAQFEGGLHVPPATFDFEEMLVAQRRCPPRTGWGRWCASKEAAIEAFLGAHGGPVDAQQPAGGAAQEPSQPGGQPRSEVDPGGGGRAVGAVDRGGELGEKVLADGPVAFGGFGVAADHEPVPHHVLVDDDFSHSDRTLVLVTDMPITTGGRSGRWSLE
jgi:hypothetical protein